MNFEKVIPWNICAPGILSSQTYWEVTAGVKPYLHYPCLYNLILIWSSMFDSAYAQKCAWCI